MVDVIVGLVRQAGDVVAVFVDRVAGDRPHVDVLAGHGNRAAGVGPDLGDVQQIVAVGVAVHEGDGHALVIGDHYVGQGHVARVGDDVGEGHRAAHGHHRAGGAVV